MFIDVKGRYLQFVKVPVIFENENFDARVRQNLTFLKIKFIKLYLIGSNVSFSKIENK